MQNSSAPVIWLDMLITHFAKSEGAGCPAPDCHFIATAAPAVKKDNEAAGIDNPLVASVGSGVRTIAPIAVK